MGHHSKKNSKNIPVAPPIDINSVGQLLNNVDINAMSNMLNGIDINQIMSMLSNIFVPATPPPPQENIKVKDDVKNNDAPPELPKAFNLSDIFQGFAPGTAPKQPVLNPVLPPNDPIVIVLNSLKPFLPSEKSAAIDDMIKLLGIKAVIDSIFPPNQAKTSEINENPPSDIQSSEIN